MELPAPPNLNCLREILDQTKINIPLLTQTIKQLPTALPPSATASEISSTLETVRHATDNFIEASTQPTTLTTIFAIRDALLNAGVVQWASEALSGFRTVPTVVARLAVLLRYLGLAAAGRTLVGTSGAVDLLAQIWHKNPATVEIVATLSSLCAGHIDNVSRVMRRRGLCVAMDLMAEPSHFENPGLMGQVLLLVAFCAICTPDTEHEASALVPALVTALDRLNERGLPGVAVHAISAIGNMCECWLKEGEGYWFGDEKSVVDAVMRTWIENRRSTDVVEAASRTLLAMPCSHPGAKSAILAHSSQVKEAISCRRKPDPVVKALLEMVASPGTNDDDTDSTQNRPKSATSDTEPEEMEPCDGRRSSDVVSGRPITETPPRKRRCQETVEELLPHLVDDGVMPRDKCPPGYGKYKQSPRRFARPIPSRKRRKGCAANNRKSNFPAENSQNEQPSNCDATDLKRSVEKSLASAALRMGSGDQQEAREFITVMHARRVTGVKKEANTPSSCTSKATEGSIPGGSGPRRSTRLRRAPRKFKERTPRRNPSVELVARKAPNPIRGSHGNVHSVSENESEAISSLFGNLEGASASSSDQTSFQSAQIRCDNHAAGRVSQLNDKPMEVIIISDDE